MNYFRGPKIYVFIKLGNLCSWINNAALVNFFSS